MHSILPTQQWKYVKSYPTIATQTNKSLSYSIHLSTNQIRVIVATLQQLFMCSLSRYSTIVNHEDDIYNRAIIHE